MRKDDTYNPSTNVMIALYYVYVKIPPSSLGAHKEFHLKICSDLHLFGRIRISTEGLNGVLSGDKNDLKSYEELLKKKIDSLNNEEKGHIPTLLVCDGIGDSGTVQHDSSQEVAEMAANGCDITSKRLSKKYGETLDIKYCHLRNDIPFETQTFKSLSVKITQEVVSLNDPSTRIDHQTRGRMNCNSRRKKARKKRGKDQEKLMKNNELEQAELIETHHQGDETVPGQCENVTETLRGISLNQFEPATHLTPQDWNNHLLSKLCQQSDTHEGVVESDAILIDARNVYESRVGHFSVDGIPTLLTNTRKYSSITSVLNAAIPHIAGKNVYMYCTGGVRCERASVYLQALAQSEVWPKELPQPKQVYQLQGGIQKYLETYGVTEHKNLEENGRKQETSPDKKPVIPTSTARCLYKGKNFVFDPRRTDPIVGQGDSTGKCLICHCLHDDYDNGHAPSENKEARCCRCRVLVLVCDVCRGNVRVWGETNDDERKILDDEERFDISEEKLVTKEKPDLFCGLNGKECIDDGNDVYHLNIKRTI